MHTMELDLHGEYHFSTKSYHIWIYLIHYIIRHNLLLYTGYC